MGTVALAVFERISQKYIHNATYKRQTEHFYLADIDKQAQERMERLTAQMKRAQRINNIQACAKEIVEKEIIFA